MICAIGSVTVWSTTQTGSPKASSPTSSLKVWTSNIRGLRSNLSDLSIQVATDKPDIICLRETFLPQDVSDSQVSLPGYSLLRYDRPKPRPGGGVALFIKDYSSLSMHCPHSPHPQEYLWLRLPLHSNLLFICVVPSTKQ